MKDFRELDYLEFFTTPFELQQEKTDLANMYGKDRYEHVVVIGRFQPLHYGHLYLIKQAATIGKKVTIGIGSANVLNGDNPYTPEQREYMLQKAIKRDGLDGKIKKIAYINDIADDKLWIQHALGQIGKVDTVVGNNDWVNECFASVNISSTQVTLLQRGIYEGKKIRAFLRQIGKL